MTQRGPFQPLTVCDSVIPMCGVGNKQWVSRLSQEPESLCDTVHGSHANLFVAGSCA